MDLLKFLAHLINGGNQPQPQAQQQAPQNQLAGQVAGHTPQPGYYDQAVRYDQAFQNGNTNSPEIVGPHAIDPMYYGYPADNTVQAPQIAPLQKKPYLPVIPKF